MQVGLAWLILTTYTWRVLLAVSAVPLLALALLYPCIPESPYFLASQGRLQDADAQLRRVSVVTGAPLPYGRLAGPKIGSPVPVGAGPLGPAGSSPLLPTLAAPVWSLRPILHVNQ